MKTTLAITLCTLTLLSACSKSEAQQPTTKSNSISPKRFQGTVINENAIFCTSSRSMAKVRAIAMANNPYASVPDDCGVANSQIRVDVVGYDPLGFAIVQNQTGRALVQQSDLSRY